MKKIISASLVCLMFLAIFGAAASAESACLSEITAATGVNSTTQLESKGYTVLFQGMNVVSDENSAVFIGYKTGGEAITDLRVSAAKTASVKVGGITYTLASGVNLNQGTAGTPLYLYATKDKKAGNGIAAVETVTVTESGDSLAGLFNDGSAPLLDVDGNLANLDKGIEGSGLYMKLISVGCVKPYIAKACLVTGSTRNAALKKAADSGCNFFVDEDINKADGVTLLAYSRTADKASALTGLLLSASGSAPAGYTAAAGSADGSRLYTAKGGETPLLEVTEASLFEGDFTLGDWATVFFASMPPTATKSVMMQEPAYGTLPAKTDVCSCCEAGRGNAGGMLYALCEGVAAAPVPAAEVTTEPATVTEPVTESETALTEEPAMTDEYFENEKPEETSATEEATDPEASASVLGGGNTTVILILAAILALGIVGVIFVKRRKNRDEEKDS